jgi:uncharacterized repeat protein (TIGR01451 family)
MHVHRPPVTSRPRTRSASLLVALSLLLAGLGLAVGSSPAAALSTFAVSAVPQQPLIAGAEADITINVKNAGPDPAEQVQLEVGLPPGITFIAGEPCVDPNSCSILPFGEIFPGETYPAVIRVAIDPDFVLDNGGGATSATAVFEMGVDYDLGSQNTNVELGVGERSDLRINKYVNPPTAPAGSTVLYQIDVDNLGPSTARSVTIQDTLFAQANGDNPNFSISSCAYSVAQGGGTITQFNCTTGPIFTGQFGNDIATMTTDRLDPISMVPDLPDPPVVHGRARAAFLLSANDAITFTNEARVFSLTADPDTSNNLATATHSFDAVADLSIDKTADVATAAPGDVVTYSLVATNDGPSDAPNVEVVDHLPAELELISATTPDGVCTGGASGQPNDPVVCRLGTIDGPPAVPDPPNAETITITARVRSGTPPGRVIANWATVGSDVPDLDNSNDASQDDVLVVAEDELFNPVTPARQFDTRDGTGGVPVGKVPGGTALEFTVTGVNGVPPGVSAVALNVTIANADAEGYATVYPCATAPGPASTLNYMPERAVANAVIAPVDAAGKVCFFTTATTNIISDVSGWFRPAAGLTTFTPVREFDTRTGTGGVAVGKLAGGSTLTFKVTGVNGVPASGVSAVALNVTVTEPDAEGLVNVFPCGAQPLTSSLNYVQGQIVPNLVIAPVSPQGTVCFHTTATTHLLADVSGWFAAGSAQHALNPSRVFDTRNGLGGVRTGKIVPGSSIQVDITGRNGVPASGVGAVVLNVTATGAENEGYVTVYPCGDLSLTSNVNLVPGRNTPNAVVAPLSLDGTVCFYSPVATDLVVDVSGWFEGGPSA